MNNGDLEIISEKDVLEWEDPETTTLTGNMIRATHQTTKVDKNGEETVHFQCDLCEYKSEIIKNFRFHYMRHTGDLPYKERVIK